MHALEEEAAMQRRIAESFFPRSDVSAGVHASRPWPVTRMRI